MGTPTGNGHGKEQDHEQYREDDDGENNHLNLQLKIGFIRRLMSERRRGHSPSLSSFGLLGLFIHFLPCCSNAKRPLPHIGKVGRICFSQ
jgi:hypothetical protein